MQTPENPSDGDPQLHQVPQFDSHGDVRGDPLNADLRVLFTASHHVALAEVLGTFANAEPLSIFYETLPPGILLQQFRAGGIRIGSLELRFVPDVVVAHPALLGDLRGEGRVETPTIFASDDLTLLVAEGNPEDVQDLRDLARPGLRVALADPQLEVAGDLTRAALESAGGKQLREEVTGNKLARDETVLTNIHHRDVPAWLAQGIVDAALVWTADALHLQREGAGVHAIALAPEVNPRAEHATSVVTGAPHPQAAAALAAFLTGPVAASIYSEFGFATTAGRILVPAPREL